MGGSPRLCTYTVELALPNWGTALPPTQRLTPTNIQNHICYSMCASTHCILSLLIQKLLLLWSLGMRLVCPGRYIIVCHPGMKLGKILGSIVSILSKVPPRKCYSHSSPPPLLPSPLLLLFTPPPPPPTFSFLLPSLPSYLTPSPSLFPSPFLLHHFCRLLLLSLPLSFPSLPSCLTSSPSISLSPSILSVSCHSPPQAQWR